MNMQQRVKMQQRQAAKWQGNEVMWEIKEVCVHEVN